MAEVVLGDLGNNVSSIREVVGGSNTIQVETPNILDGQSFRTFWIRWQNGIEVGEGPVVGIDEFMRMDGLFVTNINAVGLTTAFGAVGDFRMNSLQGEHREGIEYNFTQKKFKINEKY